MHVQYNTFIFLQKNWLANRKAQHSATVNRTQKWGQEIIMYGVETEASASIFKHGCMQRIEKVTIPSRPWLKSEIVYVDVLLT